MATGTEEKLLTKAQLRANREIKTLRFSSWTPPGLPHAETLENKGKVASFSLKIYCHKNDFTGSDQTSL